MPNIFFIADLHLGHERIVTGFNEHERGPRGQFADIVEHDEYIIERWNATVKSEDKVYILGDVALTKRALAKVAHLAGKKRIVLGNHDQEKPSNYAQFFERVYGAKCLEGMILTHIPVHPSALTRRSMQVNLHGHTHEEAVHQPVIIRTYPPIDSYITEIDPRYQCVSCEQVNYTPIALEDVKAKFGNLLEQKQ